MTTLSNMQRRRQQVAIDEAFERKFKATAKRQKKDATIAKIIERQKKFRAYH